MRKAIILPYCVEQNAPSQPLKKLFDVPSNVKERDKALIKLFNETFEEDPDDEESGKRKVTVKKGKADDYGDLIVTYGYGDYLLLVTFIEE